MQTYRENRNFRTCSVSYQARSTIHVGWYIAGKLRVCIKATFKYIVGTFEIRSEIAAHWIISLLFQPAPEGPLDTALGEIPQLLRNTPGFHYGVCVLRNVLHGEHTQFTSRNLNDSIHDEFNGRTRYFLFPLMETLRMRAILMVGCPAPATRSMVFQNSPVILSHVVNWFGYHE